MIGALDRGESVLDSVSPSPTTRQQRRPKTSMHKEREREQQSFETIDEWML